QDLLEELLGQPLPLGDVGDEQGLAAAGLGQLEERPQCVLGLLGKHCEPGIETAAGEPPACSIPTYSIGYPNTVKKVSRRIPGLQGGFGAPEGAKRALDTSRPRLIGRMSADLSDSLRAL